jgi:opacity protein-like surface antigen
VTQPSTGTPSWSPAVTGRVVKSDLRLYGGTVNAVRTFSGLRAIRPYVIGGLGYYRAGRRSSAFGASRSEWEDKLGVNGGAGLEFCLAGINTFVETRYHAVFTTFYFVTQVVPITVGVTF